MIFARARGRYGNQLFFLALLVNVQRSREHIFCTGLDEIEEDLLKNLHNFHHFSVSKKVANAIERFCKILSRVGFVGSMQFDKHEASIERKPGLLPIWMLEEEAYQREKVVDPRVVEVLRDKYLVPAAVNQALLSELQSYGADYCFIHVRRGDYLFFPSAERPASLPSSWFHAQVERVRSQVPNVQFLLFSDDLAWAQTEFSGVKSLFIVDSSPPEAFCLMSFCGSGILSPSSLSWWAGKLSSEGGGSLFIAPTYWFWWQFGKWVENTVRDSRFVTWVPVE